MLNLPKYFNVGEVDSGQIILNIIRKTQKL